MPLLESLQAGWNNDPLTSVQKAQVGPMDYPATTVGLLGNYMIRQPAESLINLGGLLTGKRDMSNADVSMALMDVAPMSALGIGASTRAASGPVIGTFGGKLGKKLIKEGDKYIGDYADAVGDDFIKIFDDFIKKDRQPKKLMDWHKKGIEFKNKYGDLSERKLWETILYDDNLVKGVDYPDVFNQPLGTEFFEHGFKGIDAPKRTLGFRFGDMPYGTSKNHSSGDLEPGISVMGTLDERLSDFRNDVDLYKYINNFESRPAYVLEGFKSGKFGSDGEPILLEGAKIVGNIKNTEPIYKGVIGPPVFMPKEKTDDKIYNSLLGGTII